MTPVSPNIFRSKRPDSMEQVRDAVIKRIINCEFGWADRFMPDKYSTQNPKGFGLVEIRLRFDDVLPPSRQDLVCVAGLLDSEIPTLVHCLHGQDRTGIVIAAHRMLNEAWTYERARDEAIQFGFHKFPYFYWLPVLKSLEGK